MNLATGSRRRRSRQQAAGATIALLPGCVQRVVAPQIDDAFTATMERRKVRVARLTARCCGAIAHHLGFAAEAKTHARQVIRAFERLQQQMGIKSLAVSATGCAAHLKDYPHVSRGDAVWEPRAETFVEALRDVSELLIEPRGRAPEPFHVAFHSACSAENSLMIAGAPQEQLRKSGYEVSDVPDGFCCGSAGSYSLLQPDIADALRARKLASARSLVPDAIATGNIGCLLHLSGEDAPPLVHYIELIDWAEGGPKPHALDKRSPAAF